MPRYQPIPLIGVALATALAGSPDARASEGRWALCSAPLLEPMPPAAEPVAGEGERIDITADRAQASGQPPIYEFTGSVRARQGDQRLSSERLRYDSGDGRVEGDSGVRLRQPGVLINAERARYWLTPQRGTFEGVSDYRIVAGHMQGQADRIIREGPTLSRYQGVTLSTCMPGREFWTLQAQRAEIDRDTRQGRAHHAVLSLGRLPVFYTPYLQFPVGSERLTGLLAPTIGQSDDNGTTVSVPWYWNIAPNQDATITPTSYWKRGAMIDTEYRYLTDWLDGEINASYLPNDDRYGSDRWAIDQTHALSFGRSIRGTFQQKRVSDIDFENDFGNEFSYQSDSFMESLADLSWAQGGVFAAIDAQSWQRVKTGPRFPYARRPRIQLGYDPIERFGVFNYDIAAEWTDFYNENPDRQQGTEYKVAPKVSLPLNTLGYRLEPAVAWQHNGYDLTNTGDGPENPSVSVPVYTVDGQLFLERPETTFAGVYQTLEPRVQYRNVPDRNQDELPEFGSTSETNNFSQLFRKSDFDITHTEQVSVGVTTRYLDDRTGREYLRASIGQTFFYHDTAERDRSDYIAQLRLNLPNGFEVDADHRWDPEDSSTNKTRTVLRWRGARNATANLALRREKDAGVTELNQLSGSFALPVARGWHLFAGGREDLERRRTLESFFGIEQSACCHSVRLAVSEERLLDASAGEPSLDQKIMLELELKGLGGIGDRIQSFLDAEIDGYNPRR